MPPGCAVVYLACCMMSPDSDVPNRLNKGETVRFPGNKRGIQCLLNSVRRRRTRRVFHLGRLKAKK